MLKIYGELAEIQKSDDFIEMSNIALALSPEAMEKFARFVMYAASEMKRLGASYDHIHFKDFSQDWDATWPDVQLARVHQNRQNP